MGTDYVVLGTYPPTQCGLATFSASLLRHLPRQGDTARVVRVLDEPDAADAPPPVVHDLVNGAPGAAAAAAAAMNRHDVAIIQHEYGIYGGPDGQDLLPLLAALSIPSITVLHTVRTEPTRWQRMILGEVIEAASAVVTMTEAGRTRVLEQYGTDPAKVLLIPHGAAPSWAANRPARQRIRRPRVLTWGLIGPGKGIEHAIDAMALLREFGVRVRYTIAGQTHPKVAARSGEAYRRSLENRAANLGVADLVTFDDRYLPPRVLSGLIRAADVVLLPYDSAEQVTSGVLIEAVAAGKPVVSTGFPHAVELLSGGAGMLVDRQNPTAIAVALRRVLAERGQAAQMSKHAAALAPGLLWPAVAGAYRQLATSLTGSVPAPAVDGRVQGTTAAPAAVTATGAAVPAAAGAAR